MKIVEIKSEMHNLKEELQEMLEIGGSVMHTVSEMCEDMGEEGGSQMGMRRGRRMGRRMGRRNGVYSTGGGYGYRRGDMDDMDETMYDD